MRGPRHQYTKLPRESQEADNPTMTQTAQTPNGQSLPSLNLNQANNSFSSRELLNNSMAEYPHAYPRKRHNPLYDRSDDLDDKELMKGQGRSGGCSSCLCFLVFLSLLGATAAICISIYVLLNRTQTENQQPAYIVQSVRNETLQARIEELVQELNSLRSEMSSYQHAAAADASAHTELRSEMSSYQHAAAANASAHTELHQQQAAEIAALRALTEQLTRNVSTVSKMPGPPGVGNLTACKHQVRSTGVHASTEVASSPVYPSDIEEYNNWVLMGVECSTNGQSALLETPAQTGPYQTFLCNCRGQTPTSSTPRHCMIHVWMCPRLS